VEVQVQYKLVIIRRVMKTVIYNNDGYSDFYNGKYYDMASLTEKAVDIYAAKDVEQIDWCLLTTMQLNYASKYTGIPFNRFSESPTMRDGDKRARENLLRIIESGRQPLELVAKRAHEHGMKCFASFRMGAFYDPDEYPFFNGAIYDEYLECRQWDKDGNITFNMSYAHPRFRQFIRNILTEAASFQDVDGINMDFCRYPYVFGYEPILVDAFKEMYGIDRRDEKVAASDIQSWHRYKADIMTAFIRETRQVIGGKKISVRVPWCGYFEFGLDVKTWVDEHLLDILIPSSIGNEEFYDISPFVDMVKATRVKLYGGIVSDLEGHDLTKEEEDMMKNGIQLELVDRRLCKQQYLDRAYELYQAGVDGIYIFNNWDGDQCLGFLGKNSCSKNNNT
jgi:Uncharacterized protein conserved in bacteria